MTANKIPPVDPALASRPHWLPFLGWVTGFWRSGTLHVMKHFAPKASRTDGVRWQQLSCLYSSVLRCRVPTESV